ncbi:hypothetical protein CC80DRAFT_498108 [Byssothecium circinans]|uniref:Uncharacterized protein n=1 Tax=Byssothecium circinans TaxID=147558 RepID=A0A6A5T8D4_9PLEO|nr:hypothetical protein CC80DRAFT_498181 [Byssothecium circinans]KAF1948616.1 hypothetical protein CC80DRAFT_498108 [Byssothecium circinans]
MKDQHFYGVWIGLPAPTVQAGVLEWLFRFQDDFLSTTPLPFDQKPKGSCRC